MIFLSFLPPMCLGILTAISLLWMWKILQQSKQPPSTCEATFKPERIPLSAMSGAVFVKRWVGPTLTDVAYICLMQTIQRVIFMWFTTHSRWCNKRAMSMKYKSVTFLSSFPFSVCSIFFVLLLFFYQFHPAALEGHVRSHNGIKPHQCSICGSSFTKGSSLKKHVRSIHEKIKPYECEVCSMRFHSSEVRKVIISDGGGYSWSSESAPTDTFNFNLCFMRRCCSPRYTHISCFSLSLFFSVSLNIHYSSCFAASEEAHTDSHRRSTVRMRL